MEARVVRRAYLALLYSWQGRSTSLGSSMATTTSAVECEGFVDPETGERESAVHRVVSFGLAHT